MAKKPVKKQRPNVEYISVRRKKRNITFRALFTRQLQDRASKEFLSVTTPIITPEMGLRFRKARVKMDLTQQEMADRFGITQTIISRIESGLIISAPLTTLQFRNVLTEHFNEVVLGGRFIQNYGVTYYYNKQIKKWVGELKK